MHPLRRRLALTEAVAGLLFSAIVDPDRQGISMARNELGSIAHGPSEARAPRLHTKATLTLRARVALRKALPPACRHGPLTDMLLWLYLQPEESEARLYQAADLSGSPASAARWLEVLLKDGLAVRRADGVVLTDAGVAILEAALEELPAMSRVPTHR